MPPKFSRKWRTECLNTRFPLPTLLCAGYSVKLIFNFEYSIDICLKNITIQQKNKSSLAPFKAREYKTGSFVVKLPPFQLFIILPLYVHRGHIWICKCVILYSKTCYCLFCLVSPCIAHISGYEEGTYYWSTPFYFRPILVAKLNLVLHGRENLILN